MRSDRGYVVQLRPGIYEGRGPVREVSVRQAARFPSAESAHRFMAGRAISYSVVPVTW